MKIWNALVGDTSVKMKIFDLLAVALIMSLALNSAIIFFLGFFNDGKVTVYINLFGEQWIEAILFPIWIIMGIVTLIRLGKKINRK